MVATIIALKGIGGFLFVFGSSFGAYLLLLLLSFTTPLWYDFYNYDAVKPEFAILLNDFLQNVALFGALLYFIGMKIPQLRTKFQKSTGRTHLFMLRASESIWC